MRNTTYIDKVVVVAALLFLGVEPVTGLDCSQCHKLQLTGDDFSAWREDTGQWSVVGEAAPAPGNDKLLATAPGAGITSKSSIRGERRAKSEARR